MIDYPDIYVRVGEIFDLSLTETSKCERYVHESKLPQWQPIESAPRDGTKIILFNELNINIGCWVNNAPAYLGSKKHFYSGWAKDIRFTTVLLGCGWEKISIAECVQIDATHWMPLPQPPKEE